MKRQEQPGQVGKKRGFRMNFLSVLLLLAVLAAAGSGLLYAHTILAKGAVFSENKKTDGTEAEAEREARKEAEEEKEVSGKIDYVPSGDIDSLDYVITDSDDAWELLRDLQYELGITNVENEYRYAYCDSGDGYDVYTMQQYHDGVEVYGAELKIAADKSGNLSLINGKYVPIGDLAVDAAVSEDDAFEYVEKYLKKEYQYDPSTLQIENRGKRICLLGQTEPVLCYLFEIYGKESDAMIQQIFVDADKGEIVSDQSRFFYEMITLDSADKNSAYKKLQGQKELRSLDVWKESDTSYALWDEARNISVGVTDQETIYLYNTSTFLEWDPTSGTPDPSAVDAMANIQMIYDYFSTEYGMQGLQNVRSNTDTSALFVTVGVQNIIVENELCDMTGNAGMQDINYMYIGRRDDAEDADAGVDLNTLCHEYTHGVINAKSSLTQGPGTEKEKQYTVQYAISEGVADIFGELYEAYLGDGTADWVHGSRNIKNPSGNNLSDAADFVEGTTDCHYGSTIISMPAYLMANGIDGDAGKRIAYETQEDMWFQSISQMGMNTDFEEVRRLIEQKAVGLNNAGSREMSDSQLECVLDAFDRTGISHSYDYALTPESTLRVYDVNNELYDNYHITVSKLGGAAVLSEDVETTSYQLDLNAGIYRVTLTDLANEDLTETFTLIVNDNDAKDKVEDYKQSENIYTKFGSIERQVVLVLDVSDSMSGTPIAETKSAAAKFVDAVFEESPNTKISIVTYSESASVVLEASGSKSALYSAINGISSYGATNMYDAVSVAQRILEEKTAKKKMMVVMSDGLPNRGTNQDGDYKTPLISLAKSVKAEDITVYTLGFFHNLKGEDLASGISLMSQIASSGRYYNVSDAGDIQYVFSGMAYDIGGNNYVLIRIACPVDVTVQYGGEMLSSAEDSRNISTEFGLLSFEGEDDETKVLRLKEGKDYEICINGTGTGTMDYSIGYADENGDYTDERTFSKVPVTKDTVMATDTSEKGYTTLNVDTDGNGTFDLKYVAGKNQEGKERNKVLLFTVAVAAGILLLILVAVKIFVAVKRHKSNRVCANCGSAVQGKNQFCQNCGAPIQRKNLFLPEKREKKKTPAWLRNVKLAVIGICLLVCAGVYVLQNAVPTVVFKQLKNQQLVSAQMLYENGVEESALSKRYLSLLCVHYVEQVQEGYEKEQVKQETVEEIYQMILEMDMGNASDLAGDYLESIGASGQDIRR